jgi:lactate permease
MTVLAGLLPIVVVLAAILSGRVGSVGAAALGVLASGAIGWVAAPPGLDGVRALAAAIATGLWLGALVGAVILGGLFFREAASARRPDAAGPPPRGGARAASYQACFLIGPFTETATGVGVGQVATTAVLRQRGLAPLHVARLALFSQMLVPWGAMANGTIVGAALSGVPPIVLGQHSAVLSVPLLLVWLPMFWLFARRAGLRAGVADHLGEVAWTGGLAAALVLSNRVFDPEIAGLVALGPVLALRFAWDARGEPAVWRAGVRRALPYGGLLAGLILSRAAVSGLPVTLTITPFATAPGWNFLTHPASWLVVVGILAGSASGSRAIPAAAHMAWLQGRKAVLAVCLFLVMAQLMAAAGMTDALAHALHDGLGPAALLAVPLLAGLFGFIAGSGNAANGLLMPAQVAVAAEASADVAWIAAIQNTTAAALTMLSPVRLAMACALAGCPGQERAVYARAWPLGILALIVMVAACALVA